MLQGDNQASARVRRTGLAMLLVLVVGLAAVICASAQAAIGPHYLVKATWGNTNLPPGGGSTVQAAAAKRRRCRWRGRSGSDG